MTLLDDDRLHRLVASARLAPSVHNIQPTRFAREGDAIMLLADPARTLPAADPAGHDVRLSHGAALEGLSLALARMGLGVDLAPAEAQTAPVRRADGLIPVVRCAIRTPGARRRWSGWRPTIRT
jgi:hypothetical protein